MFHRSADTSKDDVPSWLWRSAWIGLFAVISLGAATAALLTAGIVNPPRADTISQDVGPLADIAVPVNYSMEIGKPIALPARAYTLEITAQVSDPAITWGIAFDARPGFEIDLDSRGFFSVPPFVQDSTPFIHIRPESNRITLNVDASGNATVRINDEIAWRGAVPPAVSATINAHGGKTTAGRLSIQHITLYVPHLNPS